MTSWMLNAILRENGREGSVANSLRGGASMLMPRNLPRGVHRARTVKASGEDDEVPGASRSLSRRTRSRRPGTPA